MNAAELKAWRKDLELSQTAMAAFLGVPYRTYTKWETGDTIPSGAAAGLFQWIGLVRTLAPAVIDARVKMYK